jgi:hypothetical protein
MARAMIAGDVLIKRLGGKVEPTEKPLRVKLGPWEPTPFKVPKGKQCWAIWRTNPKVFDGRETMQTDKGGAVRRFLSYETAKAYCEDLNKRSEHGNPTEGT